MTLKRISFWLLLIAFAVACVWWILFLPYDAARVYRAVPSNSILVSEHANLAGRWKTIARNPMATGALSAFGVGEEDLNAVLDDPVVNDMVNRFAARNSVIAYTPSLGPAGEPAWIYASWAGANAQLQRWGFFSAMLRDFKPLKLAGGSVIWTLQPRKPPETDMRLSIAVFEGVLLGSFSKDPFAVRHLLERLDRGEPVNDPLWARLHTDPESSAPDRLWIEAPPDKAGGRPQYVRVGISAWDEKRLSGWIRTALVPPSANRHAVATRAKDIRLILGDAPQALILAPSENVEAVLSSQWTPALLKFAMRTLKDKTAEQGDFFAALLKPKFSGRILGLKIPSVAAGMRLNAGANGLELVAQTIDKLNARYNLGLIPSRVEVDGKPMMVVETSKSGNIYHSMKSEDRAAFALSGDWLVFSSNMAALRKLMAGWQTAESGDQLAVPAWEKSVRARPCSACAWVDLASAGRAIKDVLAVASLATIAAGNDEDGFRQRRALDQARIVVDALSAGKSVSLWLGSAGNETELEFAFGEGF